MLRVREKPLAAPVVREDHREDAIDPRARPDEPVARLERRRRRVPHLADPSDGWVAAIERACHVEADTAPGAGDDHAIDAIGLGSGLLFLAP